MAVIKCPDCNKEISEKTKKCIHCGCPIKKKKSKKKIFSLIVVIILTGIIITVGIIINNYYNKDNRETTYKVDLNLILSKILSSSISSEYCTDLISDVWYNTIWEKSDSKTDKYTKKNDKFNDDFNDSLKTLFDDEEFSSTIENIENDQDEIGNMLNDMKNPPKEYEDIYDKLEALYDGYLELSNLCINPSGNYNTYSSNVNDADSVVSKNYKKLESYLED